MTDRPPPPPIVRPLPGLVPAHLRSQAQIIPAAAPELEHVPAELAADIRPELELEAAGADVVALAPSMPVQPVKPQQKRKQTVTTPTQAQLDALILFARNAVSVLPELEPLLARKWPSPAYMVPALTHILLGELHPLRVSEGSSRLSADGRSELERVLAPIVRRGGGAR